MAAPVFVSYSRKDYYFAESLAYELRRRGVPAWLDAKDLAPGVNWQERLLAAVDAAPCLVLVASPESLASPSVALEWRRALEHGTRVIVAQARGASLPRELEGAESVDFRGRFKPALRELVARIEAAVPAPARRLLPLPPWVALLAVALGLLTLEPFALADYGEAGAAELAVVVVVSAVFVWLFPVAFVRRRMSMLRLALTFAYLAGISGYLWLQQHGATRQFFSDTTVDRVRAMPWLAIAPFGVALVGLAIVLVVRPADLLRWTPTGGAWGAYRPPLATESAEPGPAFFRLVHDPADVPAAERLRRDLLRFGEEAAGGETTAVLLVTNRTRTAWLDAQAPLRDGALLTVVGTGIRVPAALDWLWRRQLTDFRRWTMERPAHLLVPEAFTRLRPPPEVRAVHRVLCAAGAALFVAGGGVTDAVDHSPYAGVVGYAAYLSSLVWAVAAHLLLRRSPSLTSLLPHAPVAAAVTVVAGLLALQQLVPLGHATARIAVPALFLVAAPLWLCHARGALVFWLPAIDAPKAARAETLEPGRSWSTFLWFFGFGLLWLAVVGGSSSS